VSGTVVLLEGRSDVAAVRAVAAACGLSGGVHRYQLVDMGGVTNIRRELAAVGARPLPVRVVGMCDAGEARVVARAFGVDGEDDEALAAHGFSVCHADLEDELIRAMGAERVLGVLQRLGLAARFATFQNQPAWRGRPLPEQLHRFAGIASGRKAVLAGALAGGLAPQEVPAPLRRLVAAMA
jgi:hypothetical protein